MPFATTPTAATIDNTRAATAIPGTGGNIFAEISALIACEAIADVSEIGTWLVEQGFEIGPEGVTYASVDSTSVLAIGLALGAARMATPLQYGNSTAGGGLDENISIDPPGDTGAVLGLGFLSVAVSGVDVGNMAWLHAGAGALLGIPLVSGAGTINFPLIFSESPGSILVSADGATTGTVQVTIVYPVKP